MTMEEVLRVVAVLSALFGIGFAILPAAVFGPYGVALDQSGVFVARLFRAANIGFATAVWLAAGGDSATQHALGWGVIAYSVVEAISGYRGDLRKRRQPACLGLCRPRCRVSRRLWLPDATRCRQGVAGARRSHASVGASGATSLIRRWDQPLYAAADVLGAGQSKRLAPIAGAAAPYRCNWVPACPTPISFSSNGPYGSPNPRRLCPG